MTLRELIKKLEKVSCSANENLPIHAVGDDGMIDMDVVDVYWRNDSIELELK